MVSGHFFGMIPFLPRRIARQARRLHVQPSLLHPRQAAAAAVHDFGLLKDTEPVARTLRQKVKRQTYLRSCWHAGNTRQEDSNWLVVDQHPWKISISQLGLVFPRYGKTKNVPNHQPGKNKGIWSTKQWPRRRAEPTLEARFWTGKWPSLLVVFCLKMLISDWTGISYNPLVICHIALENGHAYWIFPLKIVIFHSCVELH